MFKKYLGKHINFSKTPNLQSLWYSAIKIVNFNNFSEVGNDIQKSNELQLY